MKRTSVVNWLFAILLLCCMSFHFLPRLWHEILGMLLLVPLMHHIYVHRSWWSALFKHKGHWNAYRVLTTVINILLLLDMLTVIFTGVALSNHLFKDFIPLEIRSNVMFRKHHKSLCYSLWILSGLHVGLHVRGWFARHGFSQAFSRIGMAGAVILSLWGVYASFEDRMGDRVLMKHIFATETINHGGAYYCLCMVAIFVLYLSIGWGLNRWLLRRK